MFTPSILVVEDNPDVSSYIRNLLADQGYTVFISSRGTHALQLIRKIQPNLIILDLGLPDIDGESVCKELKKNFPDITVVILTAKGNTSEIVYGLNIGADDYITKPFAGEELLARVKVRLKQNEIVDSQILNAADLSLDNTSFEVRRGNKTIKLTKTEYNLLNFLLSNKGKVLTRDIILSHVWSYTPDIETRAVDVYIGYLRKKIDRGFSQKLIQTVLGFGYMIKE